MSIINTIGYNNDRKLKKQYVHPKPGALSASLSPTQHKYSSRNSSIVAAIVSKNSKLNMYTNPISTLSKNFSQKPKLE